jgi:hypothetical protein
MIIIIQIIPKQGGDKKNRAEWRPVSQQQSILSLKM